MSDTITQAKTLRFQARSMVPVRGPQGVWVNLFGLARVVARGQTALFVETRGDLFPYDLYFDGATVTAYAPAKNVYAQKEAKGTVSDLIDRAEREEGKSFPFADLLTADPYATLTGNLTRALIVGQSNINGIQTLHLAFANDGVEWQIWLGADDHLPRLVSARYLDDPAEPDYTVAFLDWKLNAPIGDDDFTFHNKTNAAKVDFRKPDGTKVFQS